MTPMKLILSWDIQAGAESDYFEFMVSEFIPGIKRLGITQPGVWYTAYGSSEQILFSGITETADHMKYVLKSDEWANLKEKLEGLVRNYKQKVLPATNGFQL